MSEKKKRKVHTPDLKAKVGLEAVKGMKTINEIGQASGAGRAMEKGDPGTGTEPI